VLAYRVFPYLAGVPEGDPGSPSYLHHPQGQGRFDNPADYDIWYLSTEASSAVGEVFGSLAVWSEQMFPFPALPGSRRALGIYELDDDLSILDLDDAKNLLDRGLRPSQVVERNRSATQGWSLAIFNEQDAQGNRRWAGLRWWSFHRPQWRILGIWGATPVCVAVEGLHLGHPAVIDAAKTLSKQIQY
jgi:hypothetical protein